MTLSESILRQRLDSIFGLYEVNGADEYIGEPLTILEHSFQSAMLAEEEGYDEEVILAAFFHDIGHFLPNRDEMNGLGNIRHEIAGANFLYKNGFSNRIALLVRNHVEAKRYLTFKHPEYYNQLSEASKKTLEYQGGVMTKEEAEAFEQMPMFDLYLKMRTWDDLAKEVEFERPSLEKYRQMAWKHIGYRLN
ncbi:HD domain-containing protein [Arcicella rigui]|uniref:HD domain-containing protein n=1 Tax=Arcicella rigui TaxID=797020 RepID=A0ABU5Q4U9_9BACT|nr:HD domain-containing protein [Arcicella rigui]MEA5137850.1 HD domain-containing protein [Arcicella rigui]